MSSIEKLRKIINVSNKIKFDMLRDFLEIDEKTFNKKIVEWAEKFNLTIDGDEIIVNKEDVGDFIQTLEEQFKKWEFGEKTKIEKIDEAVKKTVNKEKIQPGEIETVRSKSTQFKIEIAGGAIFGALSTVVAIILSPIINASRVQGWGIALFDPTSWFWIICFLIFGIRSGLICSVTGSFGLLIIDPTGIGPAFKFFATIPHIIIPYLILRWRMNGSPTSRKLKDRKIYGLSGIASIVLRIGVMFALNFIFFATIWADFFEYMNLEVIGLANITGLSAILIFTPIINLYTGVLDVVVPYFLVFGAKLDEKFGFW
ncbi:MAG: hypothetical protein ACFFDH_06135 [Promethearchaeota archaeon]